MPRKFLRSVIAASAVFASGCHVTADAKTINVNPDTLQDALLRASGGERIILAPGQYGEVTWGNYQFHPAVTVDASRAKFISLIIHDVDGMVIQGGMVDGPRTQTYGVLVRRSKHITINGMHVTHVRGGIGVSESQDVVLAHNEFDGIRSDGINLAADQRVKVLYNDCRNFTPVPGVFLANGKHLREGDHPDCIQAWPIAGKPQPSDIEVTGNTAHGLMQGIFFGTGENGGYDRVLIRDNTLEVGYYHGILLDHSHDSVITGNTVRSTPGARMLVQPFHPITAWIRATNDTKTLICGNRIEQPRFSEDIGACPGSLKLPPKPAA